MAGMPGKSGRRNKPVACKLLAGNPGKRALNKNEPLFTPVTGVEPPEWLNEVAATQWVMLARELCAWRVLCVTDLHNLEMFCVAYANFRKSQAHIDEHGIVMTGGTGGCVKNPALTALNEAMRQMASSGGLLGLDPSSRQRLTGSGRETPKNPFITL